MASKEEVEYSVAQLMEAMGVASAPPPERVARAPSRPLGEMSCLEDLGSLVNVLQSETSRLQAQPNDEGVRSITADLETNTVTIPLFAKHQPEIANMLLTLIRSAANTPGEEKNVTVDKQRVTREGENLGTFRDDAARHVICTVIDMDRFKDDIDSLTRRVEAEPLFKERVQQLLSMADAAKKVEIESELLDNGPTEPRFIRRRPPTEMRQINTRPEITLNGKGENSHFEYNLTLEGAPLSMLVLLLDKTGFAIQVQGQKKPVLDDTRTKAHGGKGLVKMTIPVGENTAQIFNDFMAKYTPHMHCHKHGR